MGREVHESTNRRVHILLASAEDEFALQHVKRLVPRMRMQRRSRAQRDYLDKDFVTAGLLTRGQHRELLPDHIHGFVDAVTIADDELAHDPSSDCCGIVTKCTRTMFVKP